MVIEDKQSDLEEKVTRQLRELSGNQSELTRTYALLAAAVEQMPVGVLVMDAGNGAILFSNPFCERIFGPSSSVSNGSGLFENYGDGNNGWICWHPAGRPYDLEELPFFRTLKRGQAYTNLELLVKNPFGVERLVSVNTALIGDCGGNRAGVVVTLLDITEMKATAENLRVNEQRLHYALTASDEGLWDWNYKTDMGYLSPRYYEILGYENGEFPGSGAVWETMMHPDDLPQALAQVRELIEGSSDYYESQFRLRTKNGDYRLILSRAICVKRDEDSVPTRVIGTHLDITERALMEESLHRSRESLEIEVEKRTRDLKEANRKLETILDVSSESIWVCDGKGNVLSINKAAENLLHLSASHIVGKNIREILKSGLRDRSVALEVLKTGTQVTLLQDIKSTQKCLLSTGTPVFDDEGTISMVIINDRDLTRLNELQEELQRTRNVSNQFREKLNEMNLSELRKQEVIAESGEMQQILVTCLKLANLKVSTILLLGESGTGKGLLAKLIHSSGKDKNKPFVQINCAALPETLLEAELFGYEKGAFTGAHEKGKAGLFELAQGGTLFLDEIGELSLPVQAKLLKCLDEREIMHLGGLKPIKIDCTVIAATNVDLADLVRKKLFRNDLFFRLNTFLVRIPPLRDRPEDTFELTRFLLKKHNQAFNLNRRLSSRGFRTIQSHSFPGNVRELHNLIKKAVVMSDHDLLDDFIEENLGDSSGVSKRGGVSSVLEAGLTEKVNAFEKQILASAQNHCKTTRSLAAFLRLSQSAVMRKLKKHALSCGPQTGLSRSRAG